MSLTCGEKVYWQSHKHIEHRVIQPLNVAICGEMVYWQSHKHIDAYTKDLAKQLRENNINIRKVYIIIGSFFATVENVPFTETTLRNPSERLVVTWLMMM